MFNFMIFMQTVAREAGQPYALKNLNSLGFAFFFVGIMLIILLVMHWNRMKARIERKNPGGMSKKKKYDENGISQLQFMTKEELKTMILKDREGPQESDASSDPESGAAEAADLESMDDPFVDPDVVGDMEVAGDPRESQPTDVPGQVFMFDTPSDNEQPGSTFNPEAELIARLIMPDDIEKSEDTDIKPVPEIKNPYVDNVDRSPRSDEKLDQDD